MGGVVVGAKRQARAEGMSRLGSDATYLLNSNHLPMGKASADTPPFTTLYFKD